jgi:hypothetical protein
MNQTRRLRFYAMTLVFSVGASTLTMASSGSLFTVFATGANLNIRSNISGRTYPNAGIKINTAGYSLANPGSDCTMHDNGYCLFSANNASLKTIELSSSPGAVNITLCLNATGPLSCQSYNIPSNFHTAYITNYQTSSVTSPLQSTVTKCSIASDGTFSSCSSAGATGLNHPVGITLNPAETKAYITNLWPTGINANSVSLCPINSDGNFGSCTDSGAGGIFNEPTSIAISAFNDFAYITNYGNWTVSKCLINSSNGTFYSCSSTGSGFRSPQVIVINHTQTFAYVSNINSFLPVSKCVINSTTKELSSCTDSGNTGVSLFDIGSMTLNNVGNMMYFTLNGANGPPGDARTGQCPINTSTGDFENCTYSTENTGDISSSGIALNENDNLAYVVGTAGFTDSKFYECTISSGAISTCANNSTIASSLWLPKMIALAH